MPTDVFPGTDVEFMKWAKKFVATVSAAPAKFGLLPSDVANLQALLAIAIKAVVTHDDAQDTALIATKAKGTAIGNLQDASRGATRKVKGTAGLAAEDYAAAGIKEPDATRSPAGAPTSRPVVRVEPNGPFGLLLRWADIGTPNRSAKPDGIHGAEIWSFIGDAAPADPSAYTFLGLDTRTPYLDQHPAAHAGKTVFYLTRWHNKTGQTGPWSDVVSAKVPG